MNLKSYLRGIGIGILVTAAVFIISGASDKKGTMTDEMIKQRAKELGMVESSTTVADVSDTKVKPTVEVIEKKEPENEVTKAAKADENEPEEDVKAKDEPTPEPTPEVTPEPTPEPTPDPTPEPTPEPTKAAEISSDTAFIEVNSGDGSDTVSRKLEQIGIIDDAASFDKYLISQGYDRKITTGKHVFKSDDTDEAIAKNLVSSTK